MKPFILLLGVFAFVFAAVAPDSFAQIKEFADRPVKKSHNSNNIRSFANDKNTDTPISNPFFYSRANITIIRKSIPKDIPPELPWVKDSPQPDPALVFDVEIRDGMSLYNQNGWFDMSSYAEETGLMLTFNEPVIQPIIRSTQYAPVDILFIDKQGKITQIIPNISLSELEDNIYPDSPVLAFLFTKGGSCAELYINVGDEIQYSIFKKPPLILNAPREVTPPKDTHKDMPNILMQQDSPAPRDNLLVTKPAAQAKPVDSKKDVPEVTNILQKSPDELERRIK